MECGNSTWRFKANNSQFSFARDVIYKRYYLAGKLKLVVNKRRWKMAIDPVCKMEVDEKKAPAKSLYKGKMYYFCSPGCKKAFDLNPEKYLASKKAADMHP
jgi:YHS domain-containing protein